MMTYEQIAEIHRNKSMAYVGREFGVTQDRVSFVGLTNLYPFYQICVQHRTRWHEADEIPVIAPLPPTIKLDREFERVDNLLNRKTTIFAGQCSECGWVYMVEHTLGKI